MKTMKNPQVERWYKSPHCTCSWIGISSGLCHALYFWCYPSFIISWGWTAGLCLCGLYCTKPLLLVWWGSVWMLVDACAHFLI